MHVLILKLPEKSNHCVRLIYSLGSRAIDCIYFIKKSTYKDYYADVSIDIISTHKIN